MRVLTRIHHYAGRVFYFFPYLKFLPVPVLSDVSASKVGLDTRCSGGEARESTTLSGSSPVISETKLLGKDSRGGQKIHIVAAAIRDHDGIVYSLPAPKRHAHVIWYMADLGIQTPITGKQGFITNEGDFVSREEAVWVALHAGQIEGWRRQLFSEDLW